MGDLINLTKSAFPAIHKSKKDLAQEMGVHRNTLSEWHKLARASIPDYKGLCYLNKRPITRVPLSPYQCWVLGQINELRTQQITHHSLITQEFINHPERYSLLTFDKLNQQSA